MDDSLKRESKKLTIGTVIAGKYKLIEKIGAGSFGSVFKTQNLKNGDMVAAKFEKRNDHEKGVSLLIREIKVLTEVSGFKGTSHQVNRGFPQLKFYGRDDHYNFFMETYLGMNLEQLMRRCNGKFTLEIAMYDYHELAFHEKNLIHRDIKPENFTISRQDSTLIFAIDFGLAKYFRDTAGKHIPFVNNKGLIGTARYASINALQGKVLKSLGNEQSRRDDIEALAYMLIYFYLGELPWQNIQVKTKEEKYRQILIMKQNNSLEKLSEKIPACLMKFLKHSRTFEFTQTPDYENLKNILIQEMTQEINFCWDQLIADKMSVSIDVLENDFEDLQDAQLQGIQNSMIKITQQETKFILGKLNNISYLEVPKNKNSIVLDAQSPSKTIKSFNTSKMNNYEPSNQHQVSTKQFESILRVKSCELLPFEDVEPEDDDQPCIVFQNLVIGRSNSKM